MVFKLLIGLHVFVCLVLILVVLLQSSKGGGLAGAFGGGGGQTMFGGQETATFLSRLTTYLAIMFMVLSLVLAFMSARRSAPGSHSVVRQAARQTETTMPKGKSIDELLGASDTTRAAAPDTTARPW
ncbi:MAG TPA: preprotein translocase subunit SecG [Candidatus Krumholzibacteria bacterium]|nr:preprotein translocase subunit SecG [Candidatus Krumholzibacteria bacterium]